MTLPHRGQIPHIGLTPRIDGFDPVDLDEMILARRVAAGGSP